MKKLGFIGCGNMGGALAKAAAKAECEIFLADFDENKAKALAEKLSGRVCDNNFVAKNCDYIFLGVKPQVLASALADLAELFVREVTASCSSAWPRESQPRRYRK